jgi:hypothetical protein
MFSKLLLQTSSAVAKLGYVFAMLWLYASKPSLIGVGLLIVTLLAALAVTAQTRR